MVNLIDAANEGHYQLKRGVRRVWQGPSQEVRLDRVTDKVVVDFREHCKLVAKRGVDKPSGFMSVVEDCSNALNGLLFKAPKPSPERSAPPSVWEELDSTEQSDVLGLLRAFNKLEEYYIIHDRQHWAGSYMRAGINEDHDEKRWKWMEVARDVLDSVPARARYFRPIQAAPRVEPEVVPKYKEPKAAVIEDYALPSAGRRDWAEFQLLHSRLHALTDKSHLPPDFEHEVEIFFHLFRNLLRSTRTNWYFADCNWATTVPEEVKKALLRVLHAFVENEQKNLTPSLGFHSPEEELLKREKWMRDAKLAMHSAYSENADDHTHRVVAIQQLADIKWKNGHSLSKFAPTQRQLSAPARVLRSSGAF